MIDVLHLTEKRRLGGRSDNLFRRTCYSGSGSICLNTALLTTAAKTTVARMVVMQ
jgi:hypothetical protein